VTVTQSAYAFFLLIVAPWFGLSGAQRARGTRIGAPWGLVIGAGFAWAGLAMSGVLAVLVYPQYPHKGPPEHVALLTLVPAHLVAVVGRLALGRLVDRCSDDASRHRPLRRELWRLSFGVAASGLAIVGIYHLFIYPEDRALPWGAREVHRNLWSDGFLPDFSYHMKVQVSAEEARDYMARVGLTRAASLPLHASWLSRPVSMPSRVDTSWWDPSPDSGDTYSREWSTTCFTIAKYERGWLYVYALDH